MAKIDRSKEYKLLLKINSIPVWQLHKAPDRSPFFYDTALRVDADGAPNAYNPKNDDLALDYLRHAGPKGARFGAVMKPNGADYIQGPKDPFPGFLVSTTSLVSVDHKDTDTSRYADARTVPYIVLPPDTLSRTGCALGDLVFIIDTASGNSCYAIWADSKPGALGEASIATVAALKAAGNPKGQGTSVDSGVVYLVFPGSGIKGPKRKVSQGYIPTAMEINTAGARQLASFATTFDVDGQFAQAYPEYPNFAIGLKKAGYTRV